MTVPVSVQQRIRVLDAHGMSWRSIAKEVGVARDTVAKYAGREDCSPGPERSVSRPSKLDPFRATVDGWLQADRFMPRKQRHTAKRVYDRLVCIASMFVGRVRQCFSAVWADGFPRCRHRFPVM